MSSNPQLRALKEACNNRDEDAIVAALAELKPQQVANYVKMALLHTEQHPEIWQILPHIDPNLPMYGGSLLGNTASHDLPGTNPKDFHEGLSALVYHGADPNAKFFAAEAGEGVAAADIFSLAIVSQVLKPPTYHSLEHLLAMMCNKGLGMEPTADTPSKLQQLTEALHPAKLLEKTSYTTRAHTSAQAQTENALTRTFRGSTPIDGVHHRARALFDVLLRAGADPHAAFQRSPIITSKEALNVADTLWLYSHQLEELRFRPKELNAWLGQSYGNDWHTPEFVTDGFVLDRAICMYANIAAHIQRNYMGQNSGPSDQSFRAAGTDLALPGR